MDYVITGRKHCPKKDMHDPGNGSGNRRRKYMKQKISAFERMRRIGKKLIDNLELLDALPSIVSRIVTSVKALKKAKMEVDEEIKEEGRPDYMYCVSFICGGEPLTEREKKLLLFVVKGEYDRGDEESRKIMEAFIDEYMGWAFMDREDAVECSDDCNFGDDRFNFNFWCENEDDHPYGREDMELVRNVLNKLLGREAFTHYEVGGVMESELED